MVIKGTKKIISEKSRPSILGLKKNCRPFNKSWDARALHAYYNLVVEILAKCQSISISYGNSKKPLLQVARNWVRDINKSSNSTGEKPPFSLPWCQKETLLGFGFAFLGQKKEMNLKKETRKLYFLFVLFFYVFVLCGRFQLSEATKDSSFGRVKLQNRRIGSSVVFPVSGNVYPLG